MKQSLTEKYIINNTWIGKIVFKNNLHITVYLLYNIHKFSIDYLIHSIFKRIFTNLRRVSTLYWEYTYHNIINLFSRCIGWETTDKTLFLDGIIVIIYYHVVAIFFFRIIMQISCILGENILIPYGNS